MSLFQISRVLLPRKSFVTWLKKVRLGYAKKRCLYCVSYGLQERLSASDLQQGQVMAPSDDDWLAHAAQFERI